MTISIARKSLMFVVVLVCLVTGATYSPKSLGNAAPPADIESGNDDAKVRALLGTQALEHLPGDDELEWLLKQRHNAALRSLPLAIEHSSTGVPGVDTAELQTRYIAAVHRLTASQIELAKTQQERIEVRDRILALARQHERFVNANAGIGRFGGPDVHVALHERLEAQIMLLKEQKRQ